MDSSAIRRCKRSAGLWQCCEVPSQGKSYREKHLAQMKSYDQKRRIKEQEGGELEIYCDSSSKKRKNGVVRRESEGEMSDSESKRKSVRVRELKLAANSEKKKMSDGRRVNNTVKAVLKENSGEDRGRNCASLEKPSMVTVGLKEMLQFQFWYGIENMS